MGLSHHYKRLFIDLTPFFPLSLKGEGEEIFREGLCPSLTYTPPSLIRGRGQGDRLLNNLIIKVLTITKIRTKLQSAHVE